MRRSAARNCRQGGGFTFLEVILAILLLALLLALAMPRVGGHLAATGLPESGERLRSLIHLTRAAAMRDGTRYRLSFPGAPDPDDPNAERFVEVSPEPQQPIVQREHDPVNKPGEFVDANLNYDVGHILVGGVRCIAVRLGMPSFDVNPNSPFAGPAVDAIEAPMDTVTFYPDGTCDWATFTLTNLGFEEDIGEQHIVRIMSVIVDGRTGQTWFQRPLRNREKELLDEYRATPIFHVDYLDPAELTEDNILQVRLKVERKVVGGE